MDNVTPTRNRIQGLYIEGVGVTRGGRLFAFSSLLDKEGVEGETIAISIGSFRVARHINLLRSVQGGLTGGRAAELEKDAPGSHSITEGRGKWCRSEAPAFGIYGATNNMTALDTRLFPG